MLEIKIKRKPGLVPALLLIVATICCRPMILGNLYAHFALVIMALLIVLRLYTTRLKMPLIRDKHSSVLIASYILFAYCFMQGLLLSNQKQIAVQELIYLFFATTVFYLCFLHDGIKKFYIKCMYIMMMAFAISYVITVPLSITRGWDAINIIDFDYGSFVDTSVYIPFTTTYGNLMFNGIWLKRFLGFARESGIMQVFYVWGFFMADKYFRKPVIVKIILAVGVCACLSTAGFIVFGVSLVLSLNIKKFFSFKTLLTVLLAILMVYILFFSSGVSYADKAETSIGDRTIAISYGLAAFSTSPIFGHGFYDTLGNENIQTGICAISSLGQIGIVGFLLWIYIWVRAYIGNRSRKRFVYSNAAFFITAMFSQPLIFAPIMYWFLFVDYDDEKVLLFSN